MAEKKRRTYGTGSFYQRGDGLWVGSVEAGFTPQGRRRRIYVAAKDKETAKRKLRRKQRQLAVTGDTSVSARDTVKVWADTWLPLQETRLRPRSFTATRSAVTRWIIPTIGHRRFDVLSPADVRAVTGAMRAAGRSSSSQARVHSVLLSLLRAAMLEGYPVTERLLAVEAPAVAKNDRTSMGVDHAVRLLEAAAGTPQASRWVAALLQGMRQGECLGLTWDSVDFDRDRIALAWQLQPVPYRVPHDKTSGFRVPDGYEAQRVHGALHLVRPKTAAGVRVIPMIPWMRSALEEWRDQQAPDLDELVWPQPRVAGGPAKADDHAWYALQDAAGVRHPSGRYYTIHEARHTTATLLVEAGTDPAIIAAILGQSKLVQSYVHVSQSPRVAEALQNVARQLGRG